MINRSNSDIKQTPATSSEDSAAGNVVPFPMVTPASRQPPADLSDRPPNNDGDEPGPPAA